MAAEDFSAGQSRAMRVEPLKGLGWFWERDQFGRKARRELPDPSTDEFSGPCDQAVFV